MSKRRVLLGAGLLALLGLAGLVAWLTPHPGAGITQENTERIRPGMSEAEVEAVLGCPAGNYSGKDVDVLQEKGELAAGWSGNAWDGPVAYRLWVGDELAVLVFFRRGRVAWHQTHFVADQPADWTYRIRRLLPW
jgi:hypothetical protein